MSSGPPARRSYGSESVVRVLWLCIEIQPGSVGVLENWSIGMKAEERHVFLFLYLALLHYSITPEIS